MPRASDIQPVLAADRLPAAPERAGAGIVRVLMVGDVIGKPGRLAAERLVPELREARGIDLVTANGENLAGGMGLTAATARGPARPASTSSRAATTSGTSARSIPELDRERAHPAARSTTARPASPGRGWGIFHAADGTEVAVINAQGRTYMQPIENPFTIARPLLDEGADELPRDPPGRLPLRADEREERPRASTSTGASAPSSAPTRTCRRPTSGSCRGAPPTSADLGMTGPV